MQQVVG